MHCATSRFRRWARCPGRGTVQAGHPLFALPMSPSPRFAADRTETWTDRYRTARHILRVCCRRKRVGKSGTRLTPQPAQRHTMEYEIFGSHIARCAFESGGCVRFFDTASSASAATAARSRAHHPRSPVAQGVTARIFHNSNFNYYVSVGSNSITKRARCARSRTASISRRINTTNCSSDDLEL